MQILIGDTIDTLSFLLLAALFVEQVKDALFAYAAKIRSLI